MSGYTEDVASLLEVSVEQACPEAIGRAGQDVQQARLLSLGQPLRQVHRRRRLHLGQVPSQTHGLVINKFGRS